MKTKHKVLMLIGSTVFMLQSCTHDIYVDPQADIKAAYDNADAVNGSKLFTNFQHEDAGWPAVTQTDIDADASLAGLLGWPNPKYAADPTINIKDIANPPTGVTAQKNRSFYSCVGCHPTDGLGRDGVGNKVKVIATQPDLAVSHLKDCKTWDIQTLFDAIKNVGGRPIDPTKTANGLDLTLGGQTHPDFSKILTDDKIWDLVKFLKEWDIYNESTTADPNGDLYTMTTSGTYATIQPTPAPYASFSNLGGSTGDEVAGNAFYIAKCAVCHGIDGHGTTNAQGPILGVGQTNGTGGANATIPGTTSKKYGIGPFMRYRTPDAVLKIYSGSFGTIPWMAATPVTRKEMKDLLKAFNNTARYPDFATALPNP
jgi:mono/diheme cytochrome c family protein